MLKKGAVAMFDAYCEFAKSRGQTPPDLEECIANLQNSPKSNVHDLLLQAQQQGRVLVQPRCGVGAPEEMQRLLTYLEANAAPDILSLTIDAHTRLLRFDILDGIIAEAPEKLNGFPLVSHGWEVGRSLNASVKTPIEVRHGSPDGRLLFAASIASGFTSFEGGGISYNIPYSKKVPIRESLRYWQEIDAFAGMLGRDGIVIDREFFGTLTAVLVPPCIALAIGLLEAYLAAREGVKSLSVAYCQSGHVIQDIAALRAITTLGIRYMPENTDVFPVLHQFMGAFPEKAQAANSLIALGALTARLGGAAKMITKTSEEALGVPVAEANASGIRLSQLFNGRGFGEIQLDIDAIDEEQYWIETEVAELIDPILAAADPIEAIANAFDAGTLDVPFSASIYANSNVLPARDSCGAIRISRFGDLPFSSTTKARHTRLLDLSQQPGNGTGRFRKLLDDILYFAKDADAHFPANFQTEEGPSR